MSDSLPLNVLSDYKKGKLSYAEAIQLLQKPNSMKQLYIGNQSICDMIKCTNIEPVRRED